jgi:hypothetical protein
LIPQGVAEVKAGDRIVWIALDGYLKGVNRIGVFAFTE